MRLSRGSAGRPGHHRLSGCREDRRWTRHCRWTRHVHTRRNGTGIRRRENPGLMARAVQFAVPNGEEKYRQRRRIEGYSWHKAECSHGCCGSTGAAIAIVVVGGGNHGDTGQTRGIDDDRHYVCPSLMDTVLLQLGMQMVSTGSGLPAVALSRLLMSALPLVSKKQLRTPMSIASLPK